MMTIATNQEVHGTGSKVYLLAMESMTEILMSVRKGLNGGQFSAVWAGLNTVQNRAYELGRKSIIDAADSDVIVADVSEKIRLQEEQGGMTDDYKVKLAARLAIDQILQKEQGEL
jgi:hypothetical protein